MMVASSRYTFFMSSGSREAAFRGHHQATVQHLVKERFLQLVRLLLVHAGKRRARDLLRAEMVNLELSDFPPDPADFFWQKAATPALPQTGSSE